MRKWLLVALVLLAGAVLIGWVSFSRSWFVSFTRDMDAQIWEGMTEADVVAILRRPAGNYCGRDVLERWPGPGIHHVWDNPEGLRNPDGTIVKAWVSVEGGIFVRFDAEGRVVSHGFEQIPVPRPPSLAHKVRGWLRRLWP
jgi:hypothetical protein